MCLWFPEPWHCPREQTSSQRQALTSLHWTGQLPGEQHPGDEHLERKNTPKLCNTEKLTALNILLFRGPVCENKRHSCQTNSMAKSTVKWGPYRHPVKAVLVCSNLFVRISGFNLNTAIWLYETQDKAFRLKYACVTLKQTFQCFQKYSWI